MGERTEGNFEPVVDSGALGQLFAKSNQQPVVLFKHSNSCPISSGAYSELRSVAVPISLIVVQNARALSNEIVERTGVRHESPQVLVLKNEQVVWSASHWSISADGVEDAVRQYSNQ